MIAASDDVSARILLGWPEELLILRRFGLRDGLRLLDLGSGPGPVAAELLQSFPGMRMVGLDRDPAAPRQGRLATQSTAGRAAFVRGTAERLPVRSHAFDFVMARLLFQYVQAPVAAAKEAMRVLRPGGRVVLTDVDRSLAYALHPSLPELDALMDRYDAWHLQRGGDRGIGERLKDILRDAGAAHVEVETVRFESRAETAELFVDSLMGPARLRDLRQVGRISQDELEGFEAARARWLLTPGRAVTRYWRMAGGVKPG